mgnify:CR=1 FL=1
MRTPFAPVDDAPGRSTLQSLHFRDASAFTEEEKGHGNGANPSALPSKSAAPHQRHHQPSKSAPVGSGEDTPQVASLDPHNTATQNLSKQSDREGSGDTTDKLCRADSESSTSSLLRLPEVLDMPDEESLVPEKSSENPPSAHSVSLHFPVQQQTPSMGGLSLCQSSPRALFWCVTLPPPTRLAFFPTFLFVQFVVHPSPPQYLLPPPILFPTSSLGGKTPFPGCV